MLHLKNALSHDQQLRLVEMCRDIARVNPFITPVMPSGHKFNCSMSSCGRVAWTSDIKGYRYSDRQPDGSALPPMPEPLIKLAKHIANLVDEPNYRPDTCLINHYQANSRSKLGLHQDNSEFNLKPAIISISIGDDCEFAIGGNKRSDPLQTIILRSGDIIVLHGESRLAYHAVKRIIPNTSPKGLLKSNGRLNLTIRQVYD